MQTQCNRIDRIPETPEEREEILLLCPRLEVVVAARCRVTQGEVSLVWTRKRGIGKRVRARTIRIQRALINEVNRRLAKIAEQQKSGAA